MGLIIEHKKRISTRFQETIIDIETVGEFHGKFAGNYPSDSREYGDLRQIIFGYIMIFVKG